MLYIARLLLLLLAAFSPITESINPCLYNREDVLPCRDYYHHGIASPRTNQYTVHATRFQRGPSGFPICVKRKEGEMVEDIEDLGTPQLKFLFSPGAERSPHMNYINQMIAEYNVQCKEGTTAYIQFDALDLEPNNCYDGSRMKCQDYIQIDAGAGGTTEYCGNNLPTQPFIVGTGNFTMKLRTSFSRSYSGFRVFVTCFNGSEEIDSVTCTNSGGSVSKRAAVELVDLGPQEVSHRFEGVNLDQTREQEHLERLKSRPQPASLTSAELRTLATITESLFSVALSQARHKVISWPPPSYLQNDPDDILDISKLDATPDIHIQDQLTTQAPYLSLPPPRLREDLSKEVPDRPPRLHLEEHLYHRRHKRLLQTIKDGRSRLDSKATLDAVRNENACNPIVRSVTSSYITVARRLEPAQLERAQEVYQQERDLLQREDSGSLREQLIRPREDTKLNLLRERLVQPREDLLSQN